MLNAEIAQAMASVMQHENITLDDLLTKIPKGLWVKVKAQLEAQGVEKVVQAGTISARWNNQHDALVALIRAHLPIIPDADGENIPAEQTHTTQAMDSTAITTDDPKLLELVKLYRSGRISRMIKWFESQGVAPTIAVPENRPVFRFKNERVNTGIVASDLVIEAAKKKMATEKSRVGKSLSQLVEYLLWQYAGSPDDLVA